MGDLSLIGPGAIVEFYRDFHIHVKEHVRIVDFIKDGDAIAVTMPIEFEAVKDYDKHGLQGR